MRKHAQNAHSTRNPPPRTSARGGGVAFNLRGLLRFCVGCSERLVWATWEGVENAVDQGTNPRC